MTTTIISNMMPYSYGQMTNQLVSRLISANGQLKRLSEAVATASAGYTGVDGTQFEIGNPVNTAQPAVMVGVPNQNLFGVQAGTEPGVQGQAYRYAIDNLNTAWATFWEAAAPYLEQLDNGVVTM